MLRPSWPLLTAQQIEENSPSRKDGLEPSNERKQRRLAVAVIIEASQELELPYPCTSHAVLMWLRYFTIRSLKYSDAFIIACACILTASKAEDYPKSLQVRHVLSTQLLQHKHFMVVLNIRYCPSFLTDYCSLSLTGTCEENCAH